MSLTSGIKLGPYEIVAPLGAGGMGEVYRARDTRLDRTVAIKVLSSQLSSGPELKQRFEREAKAISTLNHPHICGLYDIGSQDGTQYLVMEFLEGETLAERLCHGALPLKQTLKVGMEVSEALEVVRGQAHGLRSCQGHGNRGLWGIGCAAVIRRHNERSKPPVAVDLHGGSDWHDPIHVAGTD